MITLTQKTTVFLIILFLHPGKTNWLLKSGQYCSVLLRCCLITLNEQGSNSFLPPSTKPLWDRMVNSSKLRFGMAWFQILAIDTGIKETVHKAYIIREWNSLTLLTGARAKRKDILSIRFLSQGSLKAEE